MDTKEKIIELLGSLIHPETGEDLVKSGFVEQVNASDEHISVALHFAKARDPFAFKLKAQAEALLREAFPAATVTVMLREGTPRKPQQQEHRTTTGAIRHVVAVASGKGGVGKSTVTANLAVALRNMGYRVGVLDADIYGPSQPRMFGVEGYLPDAVQEDGIDQIVPARAQDIELMSIGFFIKPTDALLWRGAMAVNALRQMIHQTRWGELDFLLTDLPPGTGDIHAAGGRGRRGARRGAVPQPAGQHPRGGHHREHGVVHPRGAARQPLLPLRQGGRTPLCRAEQRRLPGRNSYRTVDYGVL